MKRDLNKAKYFEISSEALVAIFTGALIDKNVRLVNLPDDALFQAVEPVEFGRDWKILVLSDTYATVPEGRRVSRMENTPILVQADYNGWHAIHTYHEGECPEFVMITGINGEGTEWMDRGWYGNGKWYADHDLSEKCQPTHWRPFPKGPKRVKQES